MMRKSLQAGFTLIELMVVLAIIGILVGVALPGYLNYNIRAKVTEGVVAVSPCKVSVTEAVQSGTTTIPATLCSGSSQYVESVTSGGGTGTATVTVKLKGFNNAAIDGKTLTYTGTIENSAITAWTCTSALEQKYLPSGCTSSVN